MIRLIFSTLLCICFGGPVLGQQFLGLQNSNYAGIYAIDLQPAAMADSRIRYDANFGYGLNLQNDYIGVLSSAIFDGSLSMINDSTQAWILPEHRNGKDKSLVINQDLNLPSFMISISEKHSIALTTRFRSFFNLDQVGEPAAIFAYNDRNVPDQFGTRYNNDRFSLDALAYGELGLGYAGELYNDGANYLKAGIRAKFIVGTTASYFYANELEYSFTNPDILNIHNADVSYARSSNIASIGLGNFGQSNSLEFNNTGWGADLGFVYEYRPDHETYSSGEGEFRKPRRDLNKYKFRFGFSLLDIGRVNFDKDTNSVNFSGSVDGYDLRNLRDFDVIDFDTTLRNNFDFTRTEEGERFYMLLPTVVSFQADVRFSRHLYLNFTPYIAVKGKLQPNRVHASTWYSITPRFESKWLGVGLPITHTDNEGWVIGGMAHIGPMVIGSSNFSNLWLKRDTRGANFYIGFHSPIPHKKTKDRDKDGIPDKEDACPKEAGPLANQGCPEEEDNTAPPIAENTTEPGGGDSKKTKKNKKQKKKSKGAEEEVLAEAEAREKQAADAENPTPTTENPEASPTNEKPVLDQAEQARIQRERKIEEARARAQAKAETEKAAAIKRQEEIAAAKAEEERKKQEELDRIQQEKDSLANQIATIEAAEAEEREIRREERKRREELGLPPEQLPERTKKGPTIFNNEDVESLYSDSELAIYMPFGDVDEDGVVNQDDKCPQTPGLAAFKGCPEGDPRGLPQSAQSPSEVELDAFERVYFETGSDYLDGSARLALNRTMLYLKNHPDVSVKVMGHADNIGSDLANDRLSQRRCEAAEAYLISKGVPENRIIVEFYGERLPITDNLSEEGRQRNRRIELVLTAD